jgi:beta-N-acetylhexosaminidase
VRSVIAVISLGFDPLLALGPLTLRWQTIGVNVALLIALAVAATLAPSRERLMLILVGIVPGAVVGGRIVHVLDYLGAYSANPLSIVDPRVGSLSLLGAVLGGTLSAIYVCRLLNVAARTWAAVAAVPLLIALGGGKLAQLLGGAGQGTPFDGPWAVAFVGDGPWVSLAPTVPSHPSQVYEGLWLLIGIAVLLAVTRSRALPDGALFVGALAWFLVGRFLVGFTWRDPAEIGPLNMEQFISLVALAAGGSYVWLRRDRLLRVVATAMTVVVLVGCGSSTSPVIPSFTPQPAQTPTATSPLQPTSTPGPIPTTGPPDPGKPTPTTSSQPVDSTIDSLIASMTVDQKIGQLFMVSFYGASASVPTSAQVTQNRPLIGADNIAAAIAQYHLGGVIYFRWAGNLVSASQIATLSNSIQQASSESVTGVPMLIATDQEGGTIVRLPPPATGYPGNMAIGATGSTDYARSTGREMGQELRAVGINDVLAPVGDVNVNPANPVIGLRSFGADPSSVSSLTAAMIAGFQTDAGVGATVKHFPGHGDTSIDSHTALPLITHSMAKWTSLDNPPFAAAVAAGVDSVMVGHLAFPALDASGTPASLSSTVVTGILRGQMGFGGVVITDSLQMGALRNTYGDAGIAVKAILAGDDILLMPQSLPVAWNAVKAAVQSGQISQARLDASVRRILSLKKSLGLFGASPVNPSTAAAAWGTSAHRTLEAREAQAAVTLVANDDAGLPLNGASDGPYLVVGPTAATVSKVLTTIQGRGLVVGGVVTGISPTAAAIQNAKTHAPHYGTVIVLTDDADASTGQQALVDGLKSVSTRLVTAAIGRPYDQAYYGASVNLCLYSASAASLSALVATIFGDVAPTGHLPVAITDPSVPGKVIYPLGYGLSY